MTIEKVQTELLKDGYYAGKIDGDWGPMTMSAFFLRLKKRGVYIPLPLRIAAGDLWITEIVGVKANPRILEFHNHTTLKSTSDEIAWCSAAMCAWQEEGGESSTKSAAARSWLNWGKSTDMPQAGDVAVLSRGTSEWQGHVGFYLAGDENSFLMLGGNQSNSVNVQKQLRGKLLGFRTARN